MNDIEHEVAVEWANKILSSRPCVTAGESESFERYQDWRVAQVRRIEHFATSAAETVVRRRRSPFDAPSLPTGKPDASLVREMKARIAVAVEQASKAQAALDESISNELSVPNELVAT